MHQTMNQIMEDPMGGWANIEVQHHGLNNPRVSLGQLWTAESYGDLISRSSCISLRAHADVCSIFSIQLIELVIIINVDWCLGF